MKEASKIDSGDEGKYVTDEAGEKQQELFYRAWRNWAEAAPRLEPMLDGDMVFATADDDPGELIALFGDRPVLVWDGELLYSADDITRR